MTLERQTVHVSDDSGRIAMLETRTFGTDPSPATLERYIYSNHLQSASLELDASGDIISYEEYHPYGTTSYQANNATINAVAKRYRYTGKERDEESGLYYHEARYYIPWLARWSAVDPMEAKYAGMSPYNYAFNNPVIFNDPSGADPDKDEVIYYSEPDDEIVITAERFPCDWPIVYSQSEENTPGFALNDDNLLIPGGYTVAKEKGSIYVLAMRSPEGVVYKWNDEARWYVTDDGKSFDNPWYHDIANFMQNSTRNSIGTYANDILVHGSPFYTIGESYNTYKNQGGEWGVFGFVGTGLKQSAINTFEDFKYGGHRRMNAMIGIWQFSSEMSRGSTFSFSSTKVGLFRKTINTGAFTELEVPMQMRVVKSVAEQAGVGLDGVKLSIVRDKSLIGRDIFGFAYKNRITLYPDAFRNYETLVKTLGHERTHIFQFKLFGPPKSSFMGETFESAAYGIENTFWQYYLKNSKK